MAKLNLKSVYTNESTYTVLQLLYKLCDSLDTWDLNNIEFADYKPSTSNSTYKLITYSGDKVAVDYATWASTCYEASKATTAMHADSATRALQDGNGNSIANTYALKSDIKPNNFEVLDSSKITISDTSAFGYVVRTGFRYYDSITKLYWYFFNIRVQQQDSSNGPLHLLYDGKMVNDSLGLPITLDKSANNTLLFCTLSA